MSFLPRQWHPGQRANLVEHTGPAARGGVLRREEWLFTGRRAVLERIVAWLQGPAPGAFVVTGPTGSGKSAVLERLVALSDPVEREALLAHAPLAPTDPDPGVGVVNAAVHARGMDALDVATALAQHLGLPAPRTCWQLISSVVTMPSPPLILLDGLDEAIAEQITEIVTDLLVPLGVVSRLLFATRHQEFGRRRPGTGEPGGVPLADLFGRATTILDLTTEPDTTADIEQYVANRLRAEGRADLVQPVAPALAAVAAERGGFLYARIVTAQIVRQVIDVGAAGWAEQLPPTAVAALEHHLSSAGTLIRDGVEIPGAAHDLLRALAWALGRGMPGGGVWEAVATGLSPRAARYRTADLDWVLERYGCYLIEDGADGEALYRICHREFIDHLIETAPPVAGRPAGQVLADILIGLAGTETKAELAGIGTGIGVGVGVGVGATGEPDRRSPYLRRHLARHALMAGPSGVRALHRLAQANPEIYLPELAISLNRLAAHMTAIGRRQGALVATRQATETYQVLVEVNPEAYLPGLAASQYNLAAQLADLAQHEAALLPAQQAADIYRALAEANPETYLPNLAMAQNNLAVYLSELGQRQAALVPGAEAAATYRMLAEADPETYFTNLVTALKNFAAHLAALDRISDGVDAYTMCIAAFPDSPAARDALIIERAGFHITYGDAPTGLRELATLLVTAEDNATPAPIVLAARNALRGHRTRNAPAVERAWQAVSGFEPPDWLALTPEQIAMVVEWLMAPNWAASKSFFAAHTDDLLAYPAFVALHELELLVADRADLHWELLDLVRELGLDEAYRPLLLRDLLTDWISAKNWQDSRSFAEAHAGDLLTGEAEVVLFRLEHPTATVVHLALLRLARREGIGAAYAFVTDRRLAAERMQRALVEMEPDFIAELAALEGQVFGEPFTAAAHLAVAASLLGEVVTDAARLEELAEQADPAGRQQVAAEIAELLDRVPNQAELLSVLPPVLLSPATGDLAQPADLPGRPEPDWGADR